MKTFVFDIDGTICTFTNGKYDLCQPLINHIKIINKLYDQGNKIILLTARGMNSTGGDQLLAHEKYYQFTSHQLKEWGVKFNLLYLGKPQADIYVDDRGIGLQFFEENRYLINSSDLSPLNDS